MNIDDFEETDEFKEIARVKKVKYTLNIELWYYHDNDDNVVIDEDGMRREFEKKLSELIYLVSE